ncbi:MAG: HrpE/YscL family type III secretion apparatus protein [Deltaproteobacteria bacterium]|jgi:type III secretion protein L|nr:HrpE/YscL family type III secretion apparatus protein [Deltaproteobacteria bacterium]
MASLFRIDPGHISAAPESRLIKAAEWAEYHTAAEIAEAARQYAQKLRREAEKALEDEKRRGYEHGLLEGRQEHAEQMMDTVLKSIEYIEGLEKGISALVGDALRKILGSLPPGELIAGVVRQALALARGQRQVILRIAPEDEAALRVRLEEIMREYSSITFVDLQTDARLKPGDCSLQSDMGVIDAGVETQIRAVINALEKKRKGRS